MPESFRVVVSTSAQLRLHAAAAYLRQLPATQPVTLVAATRGAADDLARRVARARGATIGLTRLSLTQAAAHAAATRLAGQGIAPATPLGAEAVAARAAFDAARESRLGYLDAVASTPGFPRALARTLSDLRAARVPAAAVTTAGAAGPDLAQLLSRVESEIDNAHTADRARLFDVATLALAESPLFRAPLVLLDVAPATAMERLFVQGLARAASTTFATCLPQDDIARQTLTGAGGVEEMHAEEGNGDLACLRRHLFDDVAPPPRALDESLQFFSAPGEGREAIEIARRMLEEATRGVPFDEMAVLVRAPQHYHGLLEHALTRAGIPGWFDRGSRRPHPAGRAFLALIACAAEGLSARRFAEYLSLGQLPPPGRAADTWVPAGDEAMPGLPADDDEAVEQEAWPDAEVPTDGDAAVAGTLRAPRRWERLLVEAAVIGGVDRWRRRLDGLARELDTRRAEALRDEPDSTRAVSLERDLVQLRHLTAFALPLVEELGAWTGDARWGEWLDRLERLAPRVLRVPAHVLRVLGDLRPMATVGPVGIVEVQSVLADRLRLVDAEPPHRRYGRVFVGGPAQARGRAFRVVFVPGLAERMFPQKQTQDPLLLDEARDGLPADLVTRARRAREERLLLHLAVGAATERLYVSFPRLDVAEGRARVPSFYALDVLRGATGRIPDHETLKSAASRAGDVTLAWPAPQDPARAIDDQEHDLAVLKGLLDAGDRHTVRGHAQYLLGLNAALRRSVTERWARGERRWSQFDGLVRLTDRTRPLLQAQRLATRRAPYSLSALQRYASCPYQFLLASHYRLAPSEQSQPLQRLDPLTRGSIVHRIQELFARQLLQAGRLPVRESTLDAALATLADVVARVAAEYEETLAPAIPKVWQEEIETIARDLRGWLRRVATEEGGWTPAYVELAFGMSALPNHDAASVAQPAVVDGRFPLRGAVDLVERQGETGALRVTDHKTGKDRTKDGMVIRGGETLQPVLYSMAVEQVTGRVVQEARLFFCTSAGGYKVRTVALTPQARRLGVEALEVIDRAIEMGMLAAAPKEGACTWCDFRPVCGPAEEQRIARKPADPLLDLLELRGKP